ncbi:MAG: CopD family protein [Pontibacterium sp.]
MLFAWVKVFHIIAMTSWMAGIFYLPRIFVHFVEGQNQGEDVRRLAIMARKLFGFMSIMAIATIALGLWLWLGVGYGGGWIHAKLLLVLLMLGYHHACYLYVKKAEEGEINRSGKFLRWFNEIPLLMFVPIVILVIFKPF